MDQYFEGQLAFGYDVPTSKCPYETGSDECEDWLSGWHDAKEENSQFGVGA